MPAGTAKWKGYLQRILLGVRAVFGNVSCAVEVKPVTAPKGKNPKLVVFDVEGVLIPRNRFFFEVGRSLGLGPLMKILFYGFLYEIGVLPLASALKRLFWFTHGAKAELFVQCFAKLPITPRAKEIFAALNAENCKTALISSGLPTFLVEDLAHKLGADYAVGVEVGIANGVLTGEIWGDVIQKKGKLMVLRELVESEGVNLKNCAVVADDRNNASLFLKEVQKIGYNPDFIIRAKSDVVVNGMLSRIPYIIRGDAKRRTFPSRNDVFRKTIHGLGFFVPLIAGRLGLLPMASVIAMVIAVYAVSEWARLQGKNVPLISAITRNAASQWELCDFTLAPIYFAIGILLTLLLFPAPANSAAIAIFAIGDSTASLIGGALSGKPLPFNRSKTLEGSLGGFFFAFLAGTLFVSPWLALVGAVVAMIVEYLPLPVNDNVMMPLCTGLALALLI
jgi:phosphoserine phosphatase/dolichol kinase